MAKWTGQTRAWAICVVVALMLSVACDGQPVDTPAAPTPVPIAPLPTPSEFNYTGVVMEAGVGPVAGVSVRWAKDKEPVYTDEQGVFSFVGVVTKTAQFEKSGFRSSSRPLPGSLPGQAPLVANLSMDRVRTLSEGTSFTSAIFPNDVEYSSDLYNLFWDREYFCRPCKYINVAPRLAGGRTIRLQWSGNVPLDLLGGEYYADGPVTTLGQTGASELVATFPPGQKVDMLLVGLERRNGAARTVVTPIDFTLTIEPAAP